MWTVLLAAGFATAQAPVQNQANDFLDGVGLSRLKDYSVGRASSGNSLIDSNDDSKRVMPGETLEIANLTGPGMIAHIWITVAENEFAWPRLLRFRVYYDGQKTPSIDAPLGDFFGVGHGAERDVSSMMIRDSSFGRARNSYWPMPYRKSCRVTVTNEGKRWVPFFYYHVDYRKYASLPADIGYLHAYYRQERPAHSGTNYAFLDTKASGHYVGTVMSVVLTQISWFGEGDDLFYVDGAKQPQLYGTGTEDYFNDAWDLRDASAMWTGTPIAEGELPGSRLSAYRWHVPDPIPFTKSIWAGIEHSGWTSNEDGSVRSGFEERPDYFSSVAFWYQKGVNQELTEPPYGFDRLPYGNATQIAVEDSIDQVKTEKGTAEVLRDVDWAKDILLFKAEGEGSKVHIPIDIPEDGKYEIVANLAQASDYGDYIALFDGELTNVDTRKPATSEIPLPGPEVFHQYLTELYVARDRTLGMFTLKKGKHVVTFVCKGKDPRSVGYNLGIQELVLEKMESKAESEAKSAEQWPKAEAKTTAGTGIEFRGRPLTFYLEKLKTGKPWERVQGARAIGSFRAEGASAMSPLALATSDSDQNLREAAVWSIGQIGKAVGPAGVDALKKELSDPAEKVRCMAAMGLEQMGAAAAPAIPELIHALDDPENYVRTRAASALGAIGPAAQPAVGALAAKLMAKGEDGFVLLNAAYALGNIGPGAKDAIPALQHALETRRAEAAARAAILKIQGKPVTVYHE